MSSKQELPPEWVLESEETRHDGMMGRDYTSVVYRRAETDATVRVFEVLQPKANAWGYQVKSSGRNGDIGSAEDLDTAKQMAINFINESEAA